MLRSGALAVIVCALAGVAVAQPTATDPPAAAPPAAAPPAEQEAEPDGDGGAAAALAALELGTYEAAALRRGLAAHGARLDPAPEGKRVRRILVVNLPVFGSEEGFLRWFNIFHRTTREYVIEREVLLRPGERWDEAVVDETRRRLRDPLFTSLVVLAPVVVEGAADQVDLLVVTRDIWSLRLNSRYELQQSLISELSLSISENNLFGYRKQVAFVFNMDLGAFTLGPQYIDKNIAGTRLQLLTRVDAVFNRDTGEPEGSQSYTSFSYPLWSLDRDWGAGVVLAHFDAVRRSFRGPDLRTYDNPDTEEVEAIPYEYGERDLDLETTVTRQLGGRALKHRIAAGHDLAVRRPRLLDGFGGDAVDAAAFTRDVLPRSERASALFTRYSLFTPVYAVYRNIDSFDLPEDQQLGPDLTVELGLARTLFGSEANFAYAAASAGWTLDLAGDGLVRAAVAAQGRLQGGELIDNVLSGSLSGATPAVLGMRLALRAAWSRRYNETNNRFFTLGGESGLRGYPIANFAGQIRVVGNVELRTLPVRVLFTRAGGVLFWDVGHAADCYSGCASRLALHQDVGIGARLLVPQLQPFVFRFDWAVPLTGVGAGLPGRFIAGIQQVF